MDPVNPYAAPRAPIDPPAPQRTDYYEEDGCLVVRNGSRLPPLCVRTGELAEADLKLVTVRHIPTWTIWAFVFLSPLIGLICMLALQRSYRVTLAISQRARARRRNGILIGIGVIVAACVGFYLGIRIESAGLLLLSVFAVWTGIFLAITLGRAYKVQKSNGDYVYLQLHADALYEFERWKQAHAPAPVPVSAAANPYSPF